MAGGRDLIGESVTTSEALFREDHASETCLAARSHNASSVSFLLMQAKAGCGGKGMEEAQGLSPPRGHSGSKLTQVPTWPHDVC